ncbi:hypothetical protein EVAR_15048_1 [Eumeta japonica]|uniref:Uncharacterized protein n=1 Tax=Eumeta variegata TaxID=151549 RepID=A0A4C1X9V8_EUMVA|nr:hypothetical protein EVAR_15048_1 [Eumeta japonica]
MAGRRLKPPPHAAEGAHQRRLRSDVVHVGNDDNYMNNPIFKYLACKMTTESSFDASAHTLLNGGCFKLDPPRDLCA